MPAFNVRVVEDGSLTPLANAAIEILAKLTPRYSGLTDAMGRASINLAANEQIELLKVMPSSGHWQRGFSGRAVHSGMTIECRRIAQPPAPPWWHGIMKLPASNPANGQGIRIGVVDFDFDPHGRLGHVHRVLGSSANRGTHGERVCRHLAEQIAPGVWGGVAPGAEIMFAAVNVGGRHDTRTLAEAIEALIESDRPPDLINMSLGFFREHFPGGLFFTHDDLEAVIDRCWEAGILPLAAVGNEPSYRVAIPAAFDSVVGVAACGLSGWGDPDSWVRIIDAEAHGGGRVAQLPSGHHVYHPYFSCQGPEVDVCGPGVGTLLVQQNGTLFDYVGTSYATPLVTGALALKLAADSVYARLTGRARARHARKVLIGMCVPLGALVYECGNGMPQL